MGFGRAVSYWQLAPWLGGIWPRRADGPAGLVGNESQVSSGIYTASDALGEACTAPPSFPRPHRPGKMSKQPVLIVVMGTSGSGKSTLGASLSTALGVPFVDGDDLHPASNVAKMSAGQPLTDDDRAPWLLRVRATGHTLASESASNVAVVACSALKRAYRDTLRGNDALKVIHIYQDIPPQVLLHRMSNRHGHFMKESMLRSQLDTLQAPTSDEPGIITIPVSQDTSMEQVTSAVVQQLQPYLKA